MAGYQQFCPIARALDVLGERWTLLVVRELMVGERHFNGIQRGIPRISRTMLSARLKRLESAGLVERMDGEYRLTKAGENLAPVLRELGHWALESDPRGLRKEDLSPEFLTWDMHRRVVPERLPVNPTMVELRFRGTRTSSCFLLVKRPQVQLCAEDGGFDIALYVDADLEALTRFWLGETAWDSLLRSGLVTLTGPAELRREFPTWFSGHLLRPRV
ncbi:winged helix-turn-helix transcriptional regulator [Streptomyces sp. NPDC093598]|uniref:winged helix-turn-helix transcriptional regulator n=1 Tax=Streptomyces sp. NPDC093598 TaxID=3366046 RepID=UPI00382C6A96